MTNVFYSHLSLSLRRSFSLCTVVGLLVGSPAVVARDDDPHKQQPPRIPLEILEYESLEFGEFIGGIKGGKVIIDPASGNRWITGEVIDLGGFHSPAKFLINGQPNARFIILLPNKVSLGSSRKGTKTKLRHLTSYPDKFGQLGPDGKAWLLVGGELRLEPYSKSGNYRGRFDIDVSYQYERDSE